MTQPHEIRTESEHEERRDLYERAVEDRERFTEAPDSLAELADAIGSMQAHFKNLDNMPADYVTDRYALAGFLVWARRDLERAAKIVDRVMNWRENIKPKPPLTENELQQLPF